MIFFERTAVAVNAKMSQIVSQRANMPIRSMSVCHTFAVAHERKHLCATSTLKAVGYLMAMGSGIPQHEKIREISRAVRADSKFKLAAFSSCLDINASTKLVMIDVSRSCVMFLVFAHNLKDQ